jgi:hypothetical protein
VTPFVYVHIQKTGGTSVFIAFQKVYGDLIYRDMSYRKERVEGMARLSSVSETNYPRGFKPEYHKILLGHFTKRKWAHLNRPFVTILRNPVERVVSRYRIYRKNKYSKDKDLLWFARKTANQQFWMCDGSLERFLFVGILERFDESMRAIAALTGTKYKKGVHVNWTPSWRKKGVNFTEAELRKVAEYNHYDMKLWCTATETFDRRYEHAVTCKS